MPSKRRRGTSVSDNKMDDDERSPTPTGPSSAKKRKKELQYDPTCEATCSTSDIDASEIIQVLFETIRNFKSEEGKLLCESFIRFPKRRTNPDYYEVVKQPIDMLKIQQKLKTDEYDEIEQLTADVELLFSNARAYYKKGSQEYIDATDLLDLYYEIRDELLVETFGDKDAIDDDDDDREPDDAHVNLEQIQSKIGSIMKQEQEASSQPGPISATPPVDSVDDKPWDADDFEQLFASVVNAQDGERSISEPFHLLPYKTVIKDPLDLKMIARKIQDNEYKLLDDMERDVNLMVTNAKTFNEPKSLIYKDACTLKKVFDIKKREMEQRRLANKSSDRIRTRGGSVQQKLSAQFAALEYPEPLDPTDIMEYEEDSGAETVMSEEENPMWNLFNAIKNYTTADGAKIIDPYMKLPSRRYYPDYYEEIKKPMSIINVQKKMKTLSYTGLDDLAADLYLVFENAKRYNADESIIYKNACLLQKVLWEKKKELEKFGYKETIDNARQVLQVFPHMPLNVVMDDLRATRSVGFALENILEGRLQAPPPGSILTRTSHIDDESDSSEVSMTQNAYEEDHSAKKGRKSTTPAPDSEKKKSAPTKKYGTDEMLRKRLWQLYKTIFEYADGSKRLLRQIFMYLPSKRDYPDYYKVITDPIDLSTIETKIKNDKYPSEYNLMSDFDLMFKNARHYNEEGSQVYSDAVTLEKALKAKWRIINQSAGVPRPSKKKTRKGPLPMTLASRLQELYETIREYQDVRGRPLSSPFMKVPPKADYPDYYEVIKRPIDMSHIQQKMMIKKYESVDEMVADCVLMFDNACKYNEPDSLIYKDALTLQRVCLEKKQELSDDWSNDVPAVQQIMTNLFISTYNHQDEEGRCYSDSFAELIDKDQEVDTLSERILTFDLIKRNLDRGQYRRMDIFQEDMFRLFDRARGLSRTDSQLYEDAIEMQMYFIRVRDDLCKNGEILITPALSFTERHLQDIVEAERNVKALQEQTEDEKKKTDGEEAPLDSATGEGSENSIRYKNQGPVLLNNLQKMFAEPNAEPHIMCIEKIFTDNTGQPQVYGNWFYRPNEISHLATRKFQKKVEEVKSVESSKKKFKDDNKKGESSKKKVEEVKSVESSKKKFKDDDKKGESSKKKVEEVKSVESSKKKFKDDDKKGESSKKKGKAKDANIKRTQISGYIVFSGEFRKIVQQQNPECNFGEISRLVGGKWRNLEKEEKEKYEKKARKVAEEQQAKREAATKAFNESLTKTQQTQQFSDQQQQQGGQSQQQSQQQPNPAQAQTPRPATPGNTGMQNGMGGPFMSPGGQRGVTPMGLQANPGQRQALMPGGMHQPMSPYPGMKTVPYGQTVPLGNHVAQSGAPTGPYPGSPAPFQGMSQGGMDANLPNMSAQQTPGQQQMAPPPPPPRPPSPMFVTVPPRTQWLLHSEAYLKYIEGLNAESRSISDWEKSLTATQDNTPVPDESRLPAHWLGQGAGYQGSVTDELWALRDLMLKDSLKIHRTLPFDALYQHTLQLDTDVAKRELTGLLIPNDDHHPGDLGISAGSEDTLTRKTSRLSKSLRELLKDHEAIPYLVQYMESCKAGALIKFWSDADSFQASTWTRIRSHSMNAVSKSSLVTDCMKKSKSYNHDITSPLSSGTGSQVSRPDDLEMSTDSCDSNIEHVVSNSVDHNSSHDKERSPCDNTTTHTSDNKDNNPLTCDSTAQATVLDSDDRAREKCKPSNDLDKSKLNLPLNNCDNSEGSVLSGSMTDSAISYRDITMSGPPSPDSGKGSSKPAISPGPTSLPKESLADKLKKSVEQDAVRIFTKYLAQEAPQPIGITDDLRNDTIRKICREDGQVDPECFLECQMFAVNRIEKLYFEGFKSSVFHCKYQVEVLTSGNIKLLDVLYNDTALFYFMEFADQEGFSQFIHFVIAMDNFHEFLSSQESYDGIQAQNDAMVLYEKYFSLQAKISLGFPDDIRFEVEGNICREEGPLLDCFAKPRFIVLYTVEKLYFPRFLTSDVYYKYLSELVSTVQQAQEFPLGPRKRRGSETSSEHSVGNQSVGSESISSKNTLLAAGYTRPVQLHKLEENMQHMALDTILLNPDALWERSTSGNMSVGRIDPLGQFVSHFVPDPEVVAADKKKGDKKQGSKFFKSRKDKEKEQEEMARKVAEKILQDVTSVTQAISAIKNPAISDTSGES